jgi:hypothetical protein
MVGVREWDGRKCAKCGEVYGVPIGSISPFVSPYCPHCGDDDSTILLVPPTPDEDWGVFRCKECTREGFEFLLKWCSDLFCPNCGGYVNGDFEEVKCESKNTFFVRDDRH